MFSYISSCLVATGLWSRQKRYFPHIKSKNTESEKLNDGPVVTQLVICKSGSPDSSGCCSFYWALLPQEEVGMWWWLRSFCVISIKMLPSPASRGQHMQQWGLVAWPPHPFFASVGLSQAAGCPSFAMSVSCNISIAPHLFSLFPWLSQYLMSRSCTYINLLHGRKEETGYDLPQILPPPLPPMLYRPS